VPGAVPPPLPSPVDALPLLDPPLLDPPLLGGGVSYVRRPTEPPLPPLPVDGGAVSAGTSMAEPWMQRTVSPPGTSTLSHVQRLSFFSSSAVEHATAEAAAPSTTNAMTDLERCEPLRMLEPSAGDVPSAFGRGTRARTARIDADPKKEPLSHIGAREGCRPRPMDRRSWKGDLP
jgi:hypothetical protein